MASHYKVELGQAIKQRREELGLTQKDLAEATHYKEAQTVSRWERGENLPSNLEAVASALQWTLAEMVAGIEPPNRRTARQFGHVPAPAAQSQLDRIEARVDAIYALLAKDKATSDKAEAEAELAKLPDLIAEADAPQKPQAHERSARGKATGRRKSA